MLRDAEMLSFDARALRERGRQQIDELTGLLRAGARELSGSEDWHALLLELNKDRPATPEAMRRGYEEWTERARQFLHDKGLVSFPPGEECLVVPSPPFERPVLAVASYASPPSFAETMRGHFFVPYPPDGASAEEIAKRLESNAYPAIPTTAVHEAYPGHHWHLVMAKGNPSHVRQLFGTSYFAEGWALYAERMMEENGFYDDLRHVMYRYEATLFRAARIVTDTSLHLGEMTHPEAVEFMRLKDASAYNIQFDAGRPILIDTLSFEVGDPTQPWPAYRQFCEHFLAPLALIAYRDPRCGLMLRDFIDGIPVDLAARLMPARTRLRPGLLAHLHLHEQHASHCASDGCRRGAGLPGNPIPGRNQYRRAVGNGDAYPVGNGNASPLAHAGCVLRPQRTQRGNRARPRHPGR